MSDSQTPQSEEQADEQAERGEVDEPRSRGTTPMTAAEKTDPDAVEADADVDQEEIAGILAVRQTVRSTANDLIGHEFDGVSEITPTDEAGGPSSRSSSAGPCRTRRTSSAATNSSSTPARPSTLPPRRPLPARGHRPVRVTLERERAAIDRCSSGLEWNRRALQSAPPVAVGSGRRLTRADRRRRRPAGDGRESAVRGLGMHSTGRGSSVGRGPLRR